MEEKKPDSRSGDLSRIISLGWGTNLQTSSRILLRTSLVHLTSFKLQQLAQSLDIVFFGS